MHSLITVDDEIPTLSATTTNTSTNTVTSSTTDRKGSNIITNGTQKSSSSSSGNGLIAWWTFEDGVGSMRVTDVTGHRYKTPIHQRFDKDKTPTTTTTSNITSINTAATVANSDNIITKASGNSKAQGEALEQETAARYYKVTSS